MKVCETCSGEIDGARDGENQCVPCEYETKRKGRSAVRRREREATLRDCGLVKVRGAMGGTYWE